MKPHIYQSLKIGVKLHISFVRYQMVMDSGRHI